MRRKDRTIIDEVQEYIEDIYSDEKAVDIISDLYQMIIELARENGALEHENSLLTRQLNLAEAYILQEEGGNDEDDEDNTPHLVS